MLYHRLRLIRQLNCALYSSQERHAQDVYYLYFSNSIIVVEAAVLHQFRARMSREAKMTVGMFVVLARAYSC